MPRRKKNPVSLSGDERGALEISRSTIFRVRTRFVEEGLEVALVHRKPKNTKPKSSMAPKRRI